MTTEPAAPISRLRNVSRRDFLRLGGAGGTLVAGAALLAACGSSPKATGTTAAQSTDKSTLTLAIAADPEGIDPVAVNDDVSFSCYTLIYEKLYQYGPNRVFQPQLATALPTVSADSLTYTIPLRTGVKFTNGKEFDSSDVKASFEAYINPKNASGWITYVSMVDEVTTPDAHTVVIKLKNVFPFMLDSMAVLPMLAANVPYSPATYKNTAIGTGPFMLKTWEHGQQLVFDANKNYWQAGEPKLNQVVYSIIPTSTAQLSGLVGGTVDIIPNLAPTTASAAKSRGMVIYQPAGVDQALFLFPNFRSGHATSDVNMRLAICWAIDRSKIVSEVYNGYATPESTMPAAGQLYYSPTYGSFFGSQANTGKAKHYLSLAGGPPKSPLSVIVPNNDPNLTAAMTIVQQNLQTIGINVNIQNLDPLAAVKLAEAGTFDLYCISAPVLIPDTQANLFWGTTALFNVSDMNDKTLTHLCDESVALPRGAPAQQASFAVQKRETEIAPIISLVTAHALYGLSPSVKGFTVVNQGDFHSFAGTTV